MIFIAEFTINDDSEEFFRSRQFYSGFVHHYRSEASFLILVAQFVADYLGFEGADSDQVLRFTPIHYSVKSSLGPVPEYFKVVAIWECLEVGGISIRGCRCL